MRASIRALLSDIVDYAGLYPPAQLEFDAALRNYAAYRASKDAWMLSRFVCPAGRLPHLTPYLAELFSGQPLRVTVIGTGGDDPESFLHNVHRDVVAIEQYHMEQPRRVMLEGYETRLPAPVLESGDRAAIRQLIDAAVERLHEGDAVEPAAFFETPLVGAWRESVSHVAEALAEAIRVRSAGESAEAESVAPPRLGFKLRCGGSTPEAYPSVEQVTAVMERCREAGVPIKFTAGLHHPMRHYDPGVRMFVHGFLNLFAAGVLAYTLALDHHDVQAIIEEQDARHFSFTNEFFGWNEAEATISEIQYARKHRVTSFGSCSFDEPRADLTQLGLME
jgi:hypothetical protein